jgi:two-component system, chemotaxis family, chemotaxis protein CheY
MPSPFPIQPRVLIVDDSAVVRQVLGLTLRQLPEFLYSDVDEAGNGAVALRKMAATRYDLVLSDIRMPLVDGLEFVRRVRQDLGDTKTPIILISTLGTEEDVQRGLAAGATGYILKPLSPHLIKGWLRNFVDSLPR